MKKYLGIIICAILAFGFAFDMTLSRQNMNNDNFRIDFRGEHNTTNIDVVSEGVSLQTPGWCTDCFVATGSFSEHADNKPLTFQVKAKKADNVSVNLMGVDTRDADNQIIPIFADYAHFVVDGEELFNEPVRVWHSDAFKHKLQMKTGQTVTISVVPQKLSTWDAMSLAQFKFYKFVLWFLVFFVAYKGIAKLAHRKRK